MGAVNVHHDLILQLKPLENLKVICQLLEQHLDDIEFAGLHMLHLEDRRGRRVDNRLQNLVRPDRLKRCHGQVQ